MLVDERGGQGGLQRGSKKLLLVMEKSSVLTVVLVLWRVYMSKIITFNTLNTSSLLHFICALIKTFMLCYGQRSFLRHLLIRSSSRPKTSVALQWCGVEKIFQDIYNNHENTAISVGNGVTGPANPPVVCCPFILEGKATFQLEAGENKDTCFLSWLENP